MKTPKTSIILKHMAEALPTHGKDDSTSDLCSSYEAIALFAHACMVAYRFRLIGYDECQKTEDECNRLAPRLSPKWNANFNSFTFLYAHNQSSMNFLIKIDRLGSKAEVRGIAIGDEQIARFEVTARDFISAGALPLRITYTPEGQEDRSSLEDKLKDIFISPSRIQDLASYFALVIIEKLAPNLATDDEEFHKTVPSPVGSPRPRHENEPTHPNPYTGPHGPNPLPLNPLNEPTVPERPFPQGDFPPPGFDDEYDLLRPTRRPFPSAARSPFNIGHDDLHPPGLGPYDPLRGSFVGGGMAGMHPTFDDPLFGNPGQDSRRDRRPDVPEGARYDPIGPGFGPPRGGRPPNPFGGFGSGDFL